MRDKRRLLLAAVLVAALAALVTAAALRLAPDREPLPYHVLLISIDTLRADHLGCFGYDRDTSPALDRLCADSVVFTQAIAQAPSTLPSHASLLTSLLPEHHGASFARRTALSPDVTTLAKVLQRAGLATASFNNGGQLSAAFGLDLGFDLYHETKIDRFGEIVEQTLGWLDERPPGRFFLFLHTYEVHHPYTPRPEHLRLFSAGPPEGMPRNISVDLLKAINGGTRALPPGGLDYIVDTYDAEIHGMDQALGWLVEELRSRGLYDDTLIVVTSDHGEEFGEHGVVGWHSHTLYDELLRVPLVVKLPGSALAGTRIDAQVRLLDVAPTILDLLDLTPPRAFAGESLLPLARGEAESVPAAASQRDNVAVGAFSALRSERWKWIQGRLYDLRQDAGEQTDVAYRHPDRAGHMKRTLALQLAARDRPRDHPAEPDDEDLERLKALGYLD